MVRMVVGYHRVREREPSVCAFAGAFGNDDLNDRGTLSRTYTAKCFCRKAKTFFQPSNACSTQYIGRS
jgi:hypothetical protein